MLYFPLYMPQQVRSLEGALAACVIIVGCMACFYSTYYYTYSSYVSIIMMHELVYYMFKTARSARNLRIKLAEKRAGECKSQNLSIHGVCSK